MKNIEIMCGKDSNTIIETLDIINNNGYGTAFILNSNNKFIGLVTDGDIRRAILNGCSLNNSIKSIMNTNPIVVRPDISKSEVLNLMIKKKIIYVIPALNEQKEVIDYYLLSDFIKDEYKDTLPNLANNIVKKGYILIIGGAGYIGSVLSRFLLNKGYKVRVLDKLLFGIKPIEDLLKNLNFDFIKGDYTNISILMKSLENISAVIHLAAIVGDPAGKVDPDLTKEVNQYGVKILTELCKLKKIKRFIFVSTCSVYGFYKTKVLNENSKLNPISLYAKTKIKAENIVISLKNNNFHPTIVRLGTVFGLSNRMRFDLVINLLAAKAIKENQITIYSGEQWRPFVHVKDVARAIHQILNSEIESISGQIFNVGSNDLNFKIKELAPIYKKIFPSIEIQQVRDKEDERSYRVSFNKIKKILNFEAKYLIKDGLKEIEKFFDKYSILNYKDSIYSNVKNFKYGILNALSFAD